MPVVRDAVRERLKYINRINIKCKTPNFLILPLEYTVYYLNCLLQGEDFYLDTLYFIVYTLFNTFMGIDMVLYNIYNNRG